jgi:hypothetical protein
MKGNNMSEDNERLISSFNAASSSLKKIAGGKAGEGIEKVYGQAYQQLVKAGIKPQLRKKYR